MYSVYVQFKKSQQHHFTLIKKKKTERAKKIILFSVCRLLVTEFLEQMKKTDHKEDIPRGYVLEDLEDHDKNIHYEKS